MAAPYSVFKKVFKDRKVRRAIKTLSVDGINQIETAYEFTNLGCDVCFQVGIRFKPNQAGEAALLLVSTEANRRGRPKVSEIEEFRF